MRSISSGSQPVQKSNMAKWLVIPWAFCLVFLSSPQTAHCQADNIFPTKYAKIHYNDEKDFMEFIWHLGGSRPDPLTGTDIAANRVDRIVERVEAILDMTPQDFTLDIYVKRGEVSPDKVAYYDNKSKSIYVSLENSGEGTFAHEVAHAVIGQYFNTPPPSKMQEILAQYVDKYLWSDY